MKKYMFFTIGLLIILSLLLNSTMALNYKWTSTAPIDVVPLSKVKSTTEFNKYINNDHIVIFYKDKNYQVINDNIFIFSEDNKPINILNIEYLKKLNYSKEIYEIKPKKIFVNNIINMNNKEDLDIIGNYISKNNGTFVYINKVPPKYNKVLINGVVVQKITPDENGEYAIDVASRKLKVDLIDDDKIAKKIKLIKSLGALNVNTTYISTGDESITLISKKPSEIELEERLNEYWFRTWNGNYTHIHYNPLKDINKYNGDNLDILAMGYYPPIYLDKAPNTFDNDPVGEYYPKTYSNSDNSVDTVYWYEGYNSENNYYHYDKGEPNWNNNDNYTSNWYVGGLVALPDNEIILNDRYDYFNNWYVKNYAYTLTNNVSGLLLPNDNTLYNLIFGKTNKDLKLNLNNKINYIVSPGYRNVEKENKVQIITIPNIIVNKYGANLVNDNYYLAPENEEFGVYVANTEKYNIEKIYKFKNNYTWICSFENYANWSRKYNSNNIYISKGAINIRNPENVKITIYTNDVNNLYKYSLKVKGSLLEDYSYNQNKLVISNPPKNILLKY